MSHLGSRISALVDGQLSVADTERALAHVGADVEITRDFDRAMNADGLLVPGVGAFSALIHLPVREAPSRSLAATPA